MANTSKKVKFLSIVLGSLLAASTSVFAQSLENKKIDLDNSAVKRSTAGQFKSDSDYIKASDIFDLQRAFLSTGYFGAADLYSSGYFGDSTPITGAVKASFGVPFANGMYLGIIGAYNFDDSGNSSKSGDTKGSSYSINSQLGLRAALRINEKIALHYQIEMVGNGQNNNLYSSFYDKQDANNDYTTIKNNGYWKHEIAVAAKLSDNMKLVVPVGLVFNANSTTYKGKMSGVDVDYTTYTDPTQEGKPSDYVAMYINPELDITMTDKGPLTGVNFGIDIGFNVDNNMKTVGKKENKQEHKVEYNKAIFNISPWVSAPLEWSLSGDKVKLSMEPKFQLGIDVDIDNGYKYTIDGKVAIIDGEKKDKKSDTVINPNIELPIGTTWRPVEWYELRLGTAMVFGAEFTVNNTTLENGDKSSSSAYKTQSGIAGYFGMGFIVGEDFNIDLYGSMGTGSADLVDLANFGGQFTYRF